MQTAYLIQLGLAIFAMLFGAGNVVFPLSLGRDTGMAVWFAILGFVITGVVMPLIGLTSAALFNGDYKRFLAMAGRWPGAVVAFMCMLLLGPFGATPRCITLAHGAVYWHVPYISLFAFSILTAVLVFAATIRRRMVVELMGRIFAPIKLVLLFTIILIGVFSGAVPLPSLFSNAGAFTKGFADGYQTLDLMGTIFFSGLIVSSIRSCLSKEEKNDPRALARYGLLAGIIGGSLLGCVYLGFSYIAAKHGALLANVETTQLLSALAEALLGAHASILANVTTTIACLTTAIALTTVFADYLAHELFRGRLSYPYALFITVALNFVMTNMGFSGIAHFVEPLVMICYPALIVLSLANIAHVLWGFQYVKPVVLTTLLISIAISVHAHAALLKAILAGVCGC